MSLQEESIGKSSAFGRLLGLEIIRVEKGEALLRLNMHDGLRNLHGKLQADAADALAIAITHAHVRATARRLGVGTRQAWSRK